jgi:flavin prenyltransferase
MSQAGRNIVVAITGASGAVYARRLVQLLAAVDADLHVHLIISPHGERLLADELGVRRPTPEALAGGPARRFTAHAYDDVGSAPAGGSFPTEGMIVCPCSSNTLGAIASGLADNLITRAAHVTLKQRRRLVLVHREMPLSEIDLRNMLRVTRAGGIICPAAPAFYMMPQTIDDLVDFVVGRVLDLFGLPHGLNTQWAGEKAQPALPGRKTARP